MTILHHLGLADERVESVGWSNLDRTLEPDHLTALYVPSLPAPVGRELIALGELVATLRLRCPWDAKQTHASLVRHLLEESYEAIEAIEELSAELDHGGSTPSAETVEHTEEELGDLLCRIFFHARLAAEEGLFDMADVARSVHDKLVRRHPHVFGDVHAESAEAVLSNWERQKQQEKGRASLMDGLPAAMPALAAATKLERRAEAAGLGFDVTGGGSELAAALRRLLTSVDDPTRSAADDGSAGGGPVAGRPAGGGAAARDVGELLLLVTRWAAAADGSGSSVDAEGALRAATACFRAAFRRVEAAAAERGLALDELGEDERRALYEQAAAEERLTPRATQSTGGAAPPASS